MREGRDGSDHLPDLRGDLRTSKNLVSRPAWWPHFTSTLRSTALTARLGRVLGIAIGICFATGLLSYYQYLPWSWLPNPACPVWGYRFTQGVHVATGTAIIPLLLIKLWSVYPNLFRWPPIRSVKHALERLSVAVLISSALVQVFTGFFNTLGWYPFPWDFATVHLYLASVLVGSILLHIGLKLPDIRYGLQTKRGRGRRADRDPVEREPGVAQQRRAAAAAGHAGDLAAGRAGGDRRRPRRRGGHHRRSDGHTVASRWVCWPPGSPNWGPQGVPVNRTAEEAEVIDGRDAPGLAARGDGPATVHAEPGRSRGPGSARGASSRSPVSRAGARRRAGAG